MALVLLAVACGARSSLDEMRSEMAGGRSSIAAPESGGAGGLAGSAGVRHSGGTQAGGAFNTGGSPLAAGGQQLNGGAFSTGGARALGGTGIGGYKLGGSSSLAGTRATGGTGALGGTASGGTTVSGGSSSGVCPQENSLCWDGTANQCVDTRKDTNHCGACRNPCQNGGYCLNGHCIKDICSQVGLNGKRTIPTDIDPIRVQVADLNRDGTLDIVTANNRSGLVTVLLGDWINAEYTSSTYACGTQPLSLAIGDLDEDGAPDIVTANAGETSLSVLLNDGLGRFPSRQDYAISSAYRDAYGVALGDLNDDGHLDAVVAMYTSGLVWVLLGNGDGTWTFNGSYPAGRSPFSPTIADLDGDERPDVALADNASVLVLPGHGDGSLGTATSFDVGAYVSTVASGDVNRDGIQDLVAVGDSRAASVFLGLGKGLFGSRLDYPVGDAAESLTLANLDSDRFPEIVTVQEYSSNIVVLPNRGDGTFGTGVTYATGSTPTSAAVGDVDRDGDLDVVVAAREDNAVNLFLNEVGDGALDPFWDFGYPNCSTVTHLAVGDFNGDGHQDVVTTGDACNWINFWSGTGTGQFSANAQLWSAYFTPSAVVAGDLDGDARDEIILSGTASSGSNETGAVKVLYGSSPVGGDDRWFAVGAGPVAVAIDYIDDDRYLDIVTANQTASTVSVLLGTGSYVPAAAVDYEVGGAPSSVAVVDVDRDGFADIVTANGNADSISVLFGVGKGLFAARSDFSQPTHPYAVAAAGDNPGGGVLAISSLLDSSVSLRRGTTARTLTADSRYPLASPAMSVLLAYIDDDASTDLITANASANSVSVFLNQGNATFGTRADYPTRSYPTALAVGDLNEDHRPDVVTANRDANRFTVLFGTCR